MNFADLIATSETSERGARFRAGTINECSFAGVTLKKSRKGKLYFISEFVIDKSTSTLKDIEPHAVGSTVSDVVSLDEDWGPGKAQQIILAGVGREPKSTSPEELSKLVARIPRMDKDTAPDGMNVARGLKVRVELTPYETKEKKQRYVTNFSHIKQTPEELAANRKRLDDLGVK